MTALSSGRRRSVRGLVLPAILLSAWYVAVPTAGDDMVWPSLPQVIDRLFRELAGGELLPTLGLSLLRDLQGLLLGGMLGLAVGVAIGLDGRVSRLVLPTLDVLKLVSVFAWIPLFMTWFGLGEGSKIAFIALVGFLPILFNTIDGVASIPRELIELGRIHRFSRFQFVFHLILPFATPAIFNGLCLALIATWMGTIGAEYMLTSGGGIGSLLVRARDNFEIDLLIVGVMTVGLIGLIFQLGSQAVERRLLRWRPDVPALQPSDNGMRD